MIEYIKHIGGTKIMMGGCQIGWLLSSINNTYGVELLNKEWKLFKSEADAKEHIEFFYKLFIIREGYAEQIS